MSAFLLQQQIRSCQSGPQIPVTTIGTELPSNVFNT